MCFHSTGVVGLCYDFQFVNVITEGNSIPNFLVNLVLCFNSSGRVDGFHIDVGPLSTCAANNGMGRSEPTNGLRPVVILQKRNHASTLPFTPNGLFVHAEC